MNIFTNDDLKAYKIRTTFTNLYDTNIFVIFYNARVLHRINTTGGVKKTHMHYTQ